MQRRYFYILGASFQHHELLRQTLLTGLCAINFPPAIGSSWLYLATKLSLIHDGYPLNACLLVVLSLSLLSFFFYHTHAPQQFDRTLVSCGSLRESQQGGDVWYSPATEATIFFLGMPYIPVLRWPIIFVLDCHFSPENTGSWYMWLLRDNMKSNI